MSQAVEFQHVTGAWMITDYDSRDDPDALPEQKTLKGRVVFQAQFDPQDRSHAIHVPDDAGAYLLSVREMTFAIVRGRLQDRQARDGVMLPAVVGGVPIVWTAVPELQEDPGVGVDGAPVAASPITFNPADPDSEGVRRVNLADVVDPTIVLPEPVESRVAQLVSEATTARDESLDLAAVTVASAEFVDQRAAEVEVNADAVAIHRAAIDTARAETDAAAGRAETASDASVAAKTDAESARDDAETAAAEVVAAVSARTSLSGVESLSAALVAGPTYLKRTLTGDSTLTIPAGTAGKVYTVTIDVQQDAAGGWTLAIPGVKWPNLAPIVRADAGAHDVIHVLWNGEEWLGMVGGQGFVYVSGGGA